MKFQTTSGESGLATVVFLAFLFSSQSVHAQAETPVPYGLCIVSPNPPYGPSTRYFEIYSDVFDTKHLNIEYQNDKAYVLFDERPTGATSESRSIDKSSINSFLNKNGFIGDFGYQCRGFKTRAEADGMRNYFVEDSMNLKPIFSSRWPLSKPEPLNQMAINYIAGIQPPKAPEVNNRNEHILVRDPDTPPVAKPAAKPAPKPAAQPKPAAKPVPKKPLTQCGRKGQRHCRARPM
jgi:hypothetical protein